MARAGQPCLRDRRMGEGPVAPFVDCLACKAGSRSAPRGRRIACAASPFLGAAGGAMLPGGIADGLGVSETDYG